MMDDALLTVDAEFVAPHMLVPKKNLKKAITQKTTLLAFAKEFTATYIRNETASLKI